MGHLGMQELANGKKVIIFSVLEHKNGRISKNVPENMRVKLIRKGDDVRFSSEGSGGQSFYDYDWQIREKVSFLVKSIRVNDTTTRYTGYFYNNKTKGWQLMTEFQTLAKGKQLGNGIYSFVEDFLRNYQSATVVRKASYTNAWASTDAKTWRPMPKARFTGDSTPSKNVDAGQISHGFFLQTGGTTNQATSKLWSTIAKKIDQSPPEGIDGCLIPIEQLSLHSPTQELSLAHADKATATTASHIQRPTSFFHKTQCSL